MKNRPTRGGPKRKTEPPQARRDVPGWREREDRAYGLVEGVDYRWVKQRRAPLKPNEPRTCAACQLFQPANSFYSSLHKRCRRCCAVEPSVQGVSRDIYGRLNDRLVEQPTKPRPKAKPPAVEVPPELREDMNKALSEQAALVQGTQGRKAKARERRKLEDMARDSQLASRILSRRRLMHYVRRFNPKYLAGWVHHDIARRLERFIQAVIDGKSPRLLLMLPPRHGKSKLASQEFVSWAFGNYPWLEIIGASYNAALPMDFSRSIRERLRDPVYQATFPGTRLDPESQSIEEWRTTSDGVYRAAGVGGGITGKGAHIFLLDDPVKNWEEADSPTQREAVWSWWLSTALTRLAPGAGVLGILTHWNEDDWAGRIQQAMRSGDGEAYEIVCYPAINEDGDEYLLPDDSIAEIPLPMTPPEGAALLRPRGTALHPERYSLESLRRTQRNFTALGQGRMWSALYQQRPTPEEGVYFRREWQKFNSELPHTKGRRIFQAWDFAITEKQKNDWIVGFCWLQDEFDNLHEMDMVRFKSDDPKVIEDEVLDFWSKWDKGRGDSPFMVGFEDGQIWKSIQKNLFRRAQERRITLNFEVLQPLTDKMARAAPMRGRMKLGKLWFLKNAPWRTLADAEIFAFPGAAHDDIVDASAWGVRLTLDYPPIQPRKPKKQKSWKDKVRLGEAGSSHMAA